jgi:hypothetical protein
MCIDLKVLEDVIYNQDDTFLGDNIWYFDIVQCCIVIFQSSSLGCKKILYIEPKVNAE